MRWHGRFISHSKPPATTTSFIDPIGPPIDHPLHQPPPPFTPPCLHAHTDSELGLGDSPKMAAGAPQGARRLASPASFCIICDAYFEARAGLLMGIILSSVCTCGGGRDGVYMSTRAEGWPTGPMIGTTDSHSIKSETARAVRHHPRRCCERVNAPSYGRIMGLAGCGMRRGPRRRGVSMTAPGGSLAVYHRPVSRSDRAWTRGGRPIPHPETKPRQKPPHEHPAVGATRLLCFCCVILQSLGTSLCGRLWSIERPGFERGAAGAG